MPSDDAYDFPTPPEGFIGYKANRIISIFDDPARVQQVLEELTQLGFAEEDMAVLAGAEGASQLDAVGDQHGLRGRIYRFVEKLGDDHLWLQRHSERLQAGAFGLAVLTDPEQKAQVAEVIAKHGGHDAAFFGTATWEEI